MAASNGFGGKVDWDDSAIDRVVLKDIVPEATAKAAGRVRDRAKINITNAGRVRTGAMRNDLKTRRLEDVDGVWWEVYSDLPYSIYQHEGVDGPIYPRRAKVLRFTPKGGGGYVFAASVSGFKGVPFLRDAVNSLTPEDYT